MPLSLVSGVEREVFGCPVEFGYQRAQVFVTFPGATLAAVGDEIGRIDPHWHAGAALVAMRPVGEQAAAAKPLVDEL